MDLQNETVLKSCSTDEFFPLVDWKRFPVFKNIAYKKHRSWLTDAHLIINCLCTGMLFYSINCKTLTDEMLCQKSHSLITKNMWINIIFSPIKGGVWLKLVLNLFIFVCLLKSGRSKIKLLFFHMYILAYWNPGASSKTKIVLINHNCLSVFKLL